MDSFATMVKNYRVPEGRTAVFWIGQAGFILKTDKKQLIAVDPYLSDVCAREFGFKRLMPYLFAADELLFDYLILSHSHLDHMDVEALPELLKCKKTKIIGARDVRSVCEELGVLHRTITLRQGERFTESGITIQAMPCDHGDLAPDAVGLMITLNGLRIYFMGDTSYHPEWYRNMQMQHVDLLVLPINGAYGNLNEEQAARVCAALHPKLAVPCHFWNFAEHGGSPLIFMEQMKVYAPEVPVTLMRMGEGMVI